MPIQIRPLCAALLTTLATTAALSQSRYMGMCDASAAVAIAQGHFLVANDEDDVLRLYKRGSPQPIAFEGGNLLAFLHKQGDDDGNPEADLEGAAASGQRIYWITSHGRKGDEGQPAPRRHRLFATDIARGDPKALVLQAVNHPYVDLLAAVATKPALADLHNAAAHPSESDKGLNIEGLALQVRDGKKTLLIGFRNPRPQGKALILPLLNPDEVVEHGATPRFGPLIRLDLGQRGIRSLEAVGKEILIVAGPHQDAKASKLDKKFALYRWSGSAPDVPSLVQYIQTEPDWTPEALFIDGQDIVLLSDDGDVVVDGKKKCKSPKTPADKKSFREQALPRSVLR
jgi:hypothetical protein